MNTKIKVFDVELRVFFRDPNLWARPNVSNVMKRIEEAVSKIWNPEDGVVVVKSTSDTLRVYGGPARAMFYEGAVALGYANPEEVAKKLTAERAAEDDRGSDEPAVRGTLVTETPLRRPRPAGEAGLSFDSKAPAGSRFAAAGSEPLTEKEKIDAYVAIQTQIAMLGPGESIDLGDFFSDRRQIHVERKGARIQIDDDPRLVSEAEAAEYFRKLIERGEWEPVGFPVYEETV